MELLKKIKAFIFTKHFIKHFGIIILTYLVVVSFVIFYLDSYTNHGQKIKVPNLVGKNINSIQALLDENDLIYEIIESKYDPKKPDGTILEQDPIATSKSTVFVKEGRIIRLRISKKTDLVEMPSLLNKSERFALQVLKNRGLKYKIEYKTSSEADGAVLNQKFKGQIIKEGQKIQIGSVILLIIGRNEGGAPVQIPNLYGLSIFAAKDSVMAIPSLTFISVCPDCINYEDSLKARVETQTPEYIEGVLSPSGTTVTIFASPNFQGSNGE
jgi:beta-lactam-binding protein with PASTA domain